MSYIGNSPGVASQRVETAFTATASQTVFTPSSGYTLGYCDVYYNGVKLVNGDDYTAADGVSITLATAAAAGDSVVVVASFPRGLSDGYLKAEADAKYVALTGDQTVAGVKTFSGSATIVNGNLGVGTSSVLGNSTFNAALGIAVRNQSTSMGYFQTYNANAGSNLKTWRFGGDASGNLVFETVNDAYSSATGRLAVDPSGRILAGIASVTYSDYLVDLYSSVDASRYLYVRNESTGTAALAGVQISSATGGDARMVAFGANHASYANTVWTGNFKSGGHLDFVSSGTRRFRLNSSGNLEFFGGVDRTISFGSTTNWWYYVRSNGNDFDISDYDNVKFINCRYNSGIKRLSLNDGSVDVYRNRAAGSTDGIFYVFNSSGSDFVIEAMNNNVPAISGIRVAKLNSTGRSINCAGTVNQNGADYAEYMTKCGDFTVAKGDVVGIDADGKLTNVFADAVTFCVKSTDPGLVGGDRWFTEPRPKDEEGNEYSANAPEAAEWNARMEAARATVDRIAFCGQVPVNVTGATPGQFIIPVNDNGGIAGQAVSNPTFEQYQIAVGKVIATEEDGRARIIVKVA